MGGRGGKARKEAELGGGAISLGSGIDPMQTKIAGAGGSNEGGVYEGSDGVLRYIKFYKDPTQAYGEALANSIYRDLGIDAPVGVVFTAKDGRLAFASEMIKNPTDIGKPTTPRIANKILKGYAADVLMANRDVIGLVNDNVKMSNRTLYRIDNGSAFLHRAMGSRKDIGDLNNISEFSYFRDKSSQYAPIFKTANITPRFDNSVRKQVNNIVRLRDRSGGWDKYVNKRLPNWKSRDKDTIIKMLNLRTEGLIKAVK